MPREVKFSYSVVNVTMHPHSAKQYVGLFNDAFSEMPAVKQKYFGNDYISLKVDSTDFSNNRGGEAKFITGLIFKYTKIGDGDWFDGQECIALKETDKPDFDTERYCPNLNELPFVFFPDGHRIFFVKAHKGKNISTAYFARALESLLNREFLQEKYGKVEVNVEMDISGIEAILGLQRIDRLQISVSLPNGDDLEEEEEEWLRSMREQEIAKISEDLKGHRNGNIKPNTRTKALMGLAQSNGTIIAHGLHHGEKIVWKSSEFPVDFQDKYHPESSVLEQLIKNGIAKLSLFTNRQRK